MANAENHEYAFQALQTADEAPAFKVSTVADRNYLMLEDLVGDAVSFTLAEEPQQRVSSALFPL
jgi:hypothetical protein